MDNLSHLAGTRVFRGVPQSSLTSLAMATSLVTLREREHLWHRGQEPAIVAIVVRGLVQIVNTSASGESTIFGVFGPGHAVGLSAVMGGNPYPASAIAAAKNTVVLKIAGSEVVAVATRDADVARALAQALIEHTNALRSKIEVLSAGSIQARIAVLLLGLAERYGDEVGGFAVLPIELSRGTIASLVSARVETVIRQMTHWQREGVVIKIDGGVRLDLERLREASHPG